MHTAWDEPEELEEAVREGHGRPRYGEREEHLPAELSDAELDAMTSWLRTFPDPEDD